MKQSVTLFHICLWSGFLSFVVIKYPDHRNLEEERVYMAYNSRFQSITEITSKQKSWKPVTYIHSQEERETNRLLLTDGSVSC